MANTAGMAKYNVLRTSVTQYIISYAMHNGRGLTIGLLSTRHPHIEIKAWCIPLIYPWLRVHWQHPLLIVHLLQWLIVRFFIWSTCIESYVLSICSSKTCCIQLYICFQWLVYSIYFFFITHYFWILSITLRVQEYKPSDNYFVHVYSYFPSSFAHSAVCFPCTMDKWS